jgi:hypothetical protein
VTFLIFCHGVEQIIVIYTYNTGIVWAPSNLTTSLQTSSPAVFQCGGQGTLLLWYINEDFVVSSKKPFYESKGFRFSDKYISSNMTTINTLTIPVTVENNNTQLKCHATGNPGPATSETFSLTIAGNKINKQGRTFAKKCVENFALSYTFPTCMKFIYCRLVMISSRQSYYNMHGYSY